MDKSMDGRRTDNDKLSNLINHINLAVTVTTILWSAMIWTHWCWHLFARSLVQLALRRSHHSVQRYSAVYRLKFCDSVHHYLYTADSLREIVEASLGLSVAVQACDVFCKFKYMRKIGLAYCKFSAGIDCFLQSARQHLDVCGLVVQRLGFCR